MKRFDSYILKTHLKIKGMLGHSLDIPKNSICPSNSQGIIYYESIPICYYTSQTGKDYFWGVYKNDVEYSKKRGKLMDKLKNSAPDFSIERTKQFVSAWENFGRMEELIGGVMKWVWYDEVLESSVDEIEYLLYCIKEDIIPFCIHSYKNTKNS